MAVDKIIKDETIPAAALEAARGSGTLARSFSYRVVKRALDIVVAGFVLCVSSPFLLLAGLLVKLTSPGPIFYRWRVVGQGGRPFTGYKLRTMIKDAERMEESLRARGLSQISSVYFKMKRDPRVTTVGKFLRKYSLDELPTLWNVLTGDMSLVGPRPARIREFERFADWHKKRLAVKPGVTGLWQVSSKNKTSTFDDIVKIDLWYIENWSLRVDLKILLKTILVVLLGENY